MIWRYIATHYEWGQIEKAQLIIILVIIYFHFLCHPITCNTLSYSHINAHVLLYFLTQFLVSVFSSSFWYNMLLPYFCFCFVLFVTLTFLQIRFKRRANIHWEWQQQHILRYWLKWEQDEMYSYLWMYEYYLLWCCLAGGQHVRARKFSVIHTFTYPHSPQHTNGKEKRKLPLSFSYPLRTSSQYTRIELKS